MQLASFIETRRATWDALEGLIAECGGRPERLGASRARLLGRTYRSAAADLSLARRAFPHEPVTRRLEQVVGAARPLVYAAPARRESLRDYVLHGYWSAIRERPAVLAVAAALLLVPALAVALWAHSNPEQAVSMLPQRFASAGEGRSDSGDLGFGLAEQLSFSSAIFTNNIQVAFLAFAGGATFGLVTIVVLVFNGGLFGLLGGLTVAVGSGGRFFELVAPHGVLELSLIVVAGSAGLRVGWAIVDPGFRPRRETIVVEARAAVQLALGTAVWLVLAGLIEGFVTPRGLGTGPALAFGLVVGGAFWAAVLVLGRPTARTPPESAARRTQR